MTTILISREEALLETVARNISGRSTLERMSVQDQIELLKIKAGEKIIDIACEFSERPFPLV